MGRVLRVEPHIVLPTNWANLSPHTDVTVLVWLARPSLMVNAGGAEGKGRSCVHSDYFTPINYLAIGRCEVVNKRRW